MAVAPATPTATPHKDMLVPSVPHPTGAATVSVFFLAIPAKCTGMPAELQQSTCVTRPREHLIKKM